MKAVFKTIVYLSFVFFTLSFTAYQKEISPTQVSTQSYDGDSTLVNLTDMANNFAKDFTVIGCWKFRIEECNFVWEIRTDNSLIFNFDCDRSNGADIYQWEYKENIFTEITDKETTNYKLEWKNANCFILKNKKNYKGQDYVLVRTICPHGDPQSGQQGDATQPKLQSKKEILETSPCSICNGTSWKNCPVCKGNGGEYVQEYEQVYDNVYENGKYVTKLVNKYVDKWVKCKNHCDSGKIRCNHRK